MQASVTVLSETIFILNSLSFIYAISWLTDHFLVLSVMSQQVQVVV